MTIYTAHFAAGSHPFPDIATRKFLKRCLRECGLMCIDVSEQEVLTDSNRSARELVASNTVMPSTLTTNAGAERTVAR